MAMMNRRDFLKSLGIIGASFCLFPEDIIAEPEKLYNLYDPAYEYGNSLGLSNIPDVHDVKYKYILNILKEDVERFLPKGKFYEIRIFVANFGRHKRIAWYHYQPIMRNYIDKPDKLEVKDNYLYGGTFKV